MKSALDRTWVCSVGSMGAARDTCLGVSQICMLADGAHNGFPCAKIVLPTPSTAKTNGLRTKDDLTNREQLLDQMQERAEVVKA